MATKDQAQNPSARKPLTQDRLRELLHYDPETGVFTRSGSVRVDYAGRYIDPKRDAPGAVVISVACKSYPLTQLACLYMTGSFAAVRVEAINGDVSDLRWANLRPIQVASRQLKTAPLTRERALECVRYDPNSGKLYRIVPRGGQSVGQEAGTPGIRGCIHVLIDYQRMLAHRLAFLIMTGRIPAVIDHIDGNPSNNAWSNLREATSSQNGANSKISKNNTSGRKGVQWDIERKCWKAKIKHNYKTIELGRFKSFEDACAAYEAAAIRIFGEYARLE